MTTEYVTREQFDMRMDSVSRHIGDLEAGHKEMRKILFGNGVPGWDEMLRALYADYEKRMQAEEDALKEAKRSEKENSKETTLQKIKGSWEFKVALISGVFMLLSSGISAWIALVVK